MGDAIFYTTVLAVTAVLVVLVAGLLNMSRGSDVNLSQKLMRWRVGLQAVAVLILMVSLMYKFK